MKEAALAEDPTLGETTSQILGTLAEKFLSSEKATWDETISQISRSLAVSGSAADDLRWPDLFDSLGASPPDRGLGSLCQTYVQSIRELFHMLIPILVRNRYLKNKRAWWRMGQRLAD